MMPPMATTFTPLGSMLADLSAWVDRYPPNAARTPSELRRVRCGKVVEEAGEVETALVGLEDSNPRKGRTHELGDVIDELLDVATTALCAVEHLTGNQGRSFGVLHKHILDLHARAGLIHG